MIKFNSNPKELILLLLLLLYCIIVNFSKLDGYGYKAFIHIILQSAFLYSLFTIIKKSIVLKIILSVFLGIGMITNLSYGGSLSLSIVMSILDSSTEETLSFIRFNLLYVIITCLICIAIIIAPPPKISKISGLFFFIGLAYILIPTFLSIKELQASENYSYHMQTGLARGYSPIYTSAEYLINQDISQRLPALTSIRGISDTISFLSRQIKTESSWSNVTQDNNSSDFLVIGIGESLRAKNIGFYGYERNTTPKLSSITKKINFYESVYSAGTNTWSSLPATLTKVKNIPDLSKSIINLANDAGYSTYWISNQAKLSHWDFSVTAIAQQADHTFFFSSDKPGSVYDIELTKMLADIAKNKVKKTLVVLHFYGSHMVFKDRYPNEYSKFKGKNPLLDEYDNSVLYTDFVQNETIKIIEKHGGKYIFFADHGLTDPNSDIPLKHDIRDNPGINALEVPLIIYPKNNSFQKRSQPISLFYFECIFSDWSQITAEELTKDNYCNQAMKNEDIHFIDSNLNFRTIKNIKYNNMNY